MLMQVMFILMSGYLFKIFAENPKGDQFIILIISPFLIALMASSFIFAVLMLLSKSPGLVINPSGIIDNTTGISAGKISWNNIKRTYVTQLRSGSFLTIEVSDPEQYLKQGNYLSRVFKWVNHVFFHSPIHISSHALDISFSEMVETIEQYHKKYGRS